jgi:hypothetical protein
LLLYFKYIHWFLIFNFLYSLFIFICWSNNLFVQVIHSWICIDCFSFEVQIIHSCYFTASLPVHQSLFSI